MTNVYSLPLYMLAGIVSHLTTQECLPLLFVRLFYEPALRQAYTDIWAKNDERLCVDLLGNQTLTNMAVATRKLQLDMVHDPFQRRHRYLVTMMTGLVELRLSIDTNGVRPSRTTLPRLSLPLIIPSNLKRAEIGGPASDVRMDRRNLHWDINEAINFFEHEKLTHLKINNATCRDIAHYPLIDGRIVNRSTTSLRHLSLFNCELKNWTTRQDRLNLPWNDLGTMLAFPRSLKSLSITYHWDPNGTLWADGVDCDAFHILQGITQSPAVNTLVALRFDLMHSNRATGPIPGMHQLLQCRYLETSASHLQFIIETRGRREQFPDHFATFDYAELFPPNLEILKITLGVTEFHLVEALLRNNAMTTGDFHLPFLHRIMIQKRAGVNILPNLKKIIISDRYTQDAQRSRTVEPVKTGKMGDWLERRYGPLLRTTDFATLEQRLAAQCSRVGVETMFLKEWLPAAKTRDSGYRAFWEEPGEQFGNNRAVGGGLEWVAGGFT